MHPAVQLYELPTPQGNGTPRRTIISTLQVGEVRPRNRRQAEGSQEGLPARKLLSVASCSLCQTEGRASSSPQTGREEPPHSTASRNRGYLRPCCRKTGQNLIHLLISPLKPGVHMPTFAANVKNRNRHWTNVCLIIEASRCLIPFSVTYKMERTEEETQIWMLAECRFDVGPFQKLKFCFWWEDACKNAFSMAPCMWIHSPPLPRLCYLDITIPTSLSDLPTLTFCFWKLSIKILSILYFGETVWGNAIVKLDFSFDIRRPVSNPIPCISIETLGFDIILGRKHFKNETIEFSRWSWGPLSLREYTSKSKAFQSF